MKIFHVSQNRNNDYDTFSDFVIIAKDEEEARNTNPHGDKWNSEKKGWGLKGYNFNSWVTPDLVTVVYLGISKEKETRLVCCSFDAG